jgi:hypothetical protein
MASRERADGSELNVIPIMMRLDSTSGCATIDTAMLDDVDRDQIRALLAPEIFHPIFNLLVNFFESF